MRRRGAFLVTALVFLFFAEAQRALFGSLFAVVYDAIFPVFDARSALPLLLPLLALLAPFFPLARLVDRRGAVAVAAAGVAVFRLPMAHPALATRLAGGSLVLAFFALFLTWAVGLFDRRALAAGAVAGLVADQLLRLAGTSYDLSLQPAWVPAQALLSIALLAAAVWWGRDPAGESAGGGARGDHRLERRTGGLRLRGGLALGVLLFLDLERLGLPPVVARTTGLPYEAAAIAHAAGGAAALGLLLAAPATTPGRRVALAMVGLIGLALVTAEWTGGAAAGVLMAVAHGATLLLVARSLDPASGRRSRGVAAAGLGLFVALTVVYSSTFFASYTVPALDGGAPWVWGGALVVLAGLVVLLPQAAGTAPALRPAAGVAVGAGLTAAAAALAFWVVPRAPAPTRASGPELRLATLNVHYGFDESWRFEPWALAALLGRMGPDVAALQEVPAGLPSAYGVDLTLWLERRQRAPGFFSPTAGKLLGEAVLSRVPAPDPEVRPLPGRRGERSQVLDLRVRAGGRALAVHTLHLSVDPRVGAAQAAAALNGLPAGPAVVMGDLNADGDGRVAAMLRAAGFRDAAAAADSEEAADAESAEAADAESAEAAEAVGARGGPTFPAQSPRRRIDWIWIRGAAVVDAAVVDAVVSDHRPVTATIRWPETGATDGGS